MNRIAIAAALIALLLQSGQAIAQSEEKTYFTLLELCASDDASPEAIQEFLDLRVDVNIRDEMRNTPLLLCAKRGDVASSKFLIENGADVDAQDKNSLAALYHARKGKHKELETVLIRAGAREHPTWIFIDGKTIFDIARNPRSRSFQFSWHIDALNEAGVPLNSTCRFGRTTLHYASRFNKDGDVISFLIDSGMDVNAKSPFQRTPLHDAAKNNTTLEISQALLRGGADPNATSIRGETPIHFAAESNSNPEVLKTLIRSGASIEAETNSSLRPIHLAAGGKMSDVTVQALIDAGANVNATTKIGMRPIHFAAAKEMGSETVRILLDAGANANAETLGGWTPIQLAAKSNQPEAIDQLLKSRASLEKAAGGQTLLHLAARFNKHAGSILTLIKSGQQIDAEDHEGWTPLDLAAGHNGPEVVTILIQAGANVTDARSGGLTPLHIAAVQCGTSTNPAVVKKKLM